MTRLYLRCFSIATLVALFSVWETQAQPVNDPGYSLQTYLQTINASSAWNITTGSSSVKIAVIGGGNVRPTHEDLGSKTTIPPLRNRTTYARQPVTATAAAGIAAAFTNNGKGIAGINWSAPILSYDPGELLTIGGNPTPFHVLKLSSVDDDINDAVSRGAQILLTPFQAFYRNPTVNFQYNPDAEAIDVPISDMNISGNLFENAKRVMSSFYDLHKENQKWSDAIGAFKNAYMQGRTVIAPMGDFAGAPLDALPSGLSNDKLVISVGSVTSADELFSFSGSGAPGSTPENTTIDVVAPGVNIYTALNTGNSAYGENTSTSMSAGMVAGIASLLKSYSTSLEPDDIREILRRTAMDVGDPGFDARTGFGRVDAGAAMSYAQTRTFTRGVATGGTAVKVGHYSSILLSPGPWDSDVAIAPGRYGSVDVYKVTFEINLPTGAQHDVWHRASGTIGWANTGDTDARRYARVESVRSYESKATVSTYLYYIRYDALGRSLPNKWYPASPTSAQVAYTIATKPGLPPPPPVPPAPTNLTITNAMTDGQHPHLTWNAVSGATSYKVYRCYDDPGNSINECSNDANWTYVLTTSNTSVYDYAVTMQSYCYMTGQGTWKMAKYRVTAIRDGQESNPSTEAGTCTNQKASKMAPLADLDVQEALPEEFALHSNYPNPFNPSTEIRFDLPEAAYVRVTVYDVMGREVARLIDHMMEAGYQQVTWDAGNVPSGVYLYRIEAGDFSQSRSMILQK